MALALYRKYRPRTFAEVIGQEHVTEPLMQALRTGRLNHAYLFSGPRGCGKTSSARILARSLNCEKGPTPEPCGVCDSCVALAPDGSGSLDVIEIDAASHGGVDDARDLRERAFFAPALSRFKVYIIDEAHMISSQGFNALLKLVEEPPEYIKFVFATTEPEKVLGTIRSRTHHYPFRLIPPGVLRPYLEKLCQWEGVAVEPAVFPLVVRAGGGSARDSESVLDQLISGAGPDGVTYAHAVALLGVTDVALIDEMCDALAAGDGAAVFATIDRVAEAGHDARRFAGDLLERLRDLIVFQQVPDAAAKGLLDVPADELGRMESQAQRFGAATLSRMADIVHTGLTEMRGTTAPRLLLELISARMLLPGADDSSGALLQRLERMERRLTATGDPLPPAHPATSGAPAHPTTGGSPAHTATSGSPGAPAGPGGAVADSGRAGAAGGPTGTAAGPAGSESGPATPSGRTRTGPGRDANAETVPDAAASGPAAVPVHAAVTEAGAAPDQAAPQPGPGVVDAQAVRRVWEEILGYVRRRSQRAAAVVREAVVRDVEGDTVVLTFRHQFHAESLTSSPQLLEEAIYEVLGGRWRVRAEWPGGSGSPAAAPARRAAPGSPAATEQPAGDQSGRSPATPRATAQRPNPATGQDSPAGPANPTASAAGPGANRAGGSPGAVAADDDWPDIAQPGGAAAAAVTSATVLAPVREAPTTRTVPGEVPVPRDNPPRAAESGRSGRGRAPSRSDAAGRGAAARTAPAARRGGTARGAGTRRAGTGDPAWQEAPPPDEPPFDPDYDRPVADHYDGFDPGDEPLDDGALDSRVARESSEEQALRLLRETLGAEKIGD